MMESYLVKLCELPVKVNYILLHITQTVGVDYGSYRSYTLR